MDIMQIVLTVCHRTFCLIILIKAAWPKICEKSVFGISLKLINCAILLLIDMGAFSRVNSFILTVYIKQHLCLVSKVKCTFLDLRGGLRWLQPHLWSENNFTKNTVNFWQMLDLQPSPSSLIFKDRMGTKIVMRSRNLNPLSKIDPPMNTCTSQSSLSIVKVCGLCCPLRFCGSGDVIGGGGILPNFCECRGGHDPPPTPTHSGMLWGVIARDNLFPILLLYYF